MEKCHHYMRLHFKLKMCQNRLAAGLRPDPQGNIILSVLLDSQSHSGRPEKGQCLTPPSRSYGRVAVGEGGGRRTDRNMKGELEGGIG